MALIFVARLFYYFRKDSRIFELEQLVCVRIVLQCETGVKHLLFVLICRYLNCVYPLCC